MEAMATKNTSDTPPVLPGATTPEHPPLPKHQDDATPPPVVKVAPDPPASVPKPAPAMPKGEAPDVVAARIIVNDKLRGHGVKITGDLGKDVYEALRL